MSSASANVVAPTGITIRSWMSMRRPACAPPPKIWISGSGSVTASRPARWRHSGSPRAAAAAWATASDTATDRVAAQPRLVGRAVERDQRASTVGLVQRVAAGERARDRAR